MGNIAILNDYKLKNNSEKSKTIQFWNFFLSFYIKSFHLSIRFMGFINRKHRHLERLQTWKKILEKFSSCLIWFQQNFTTAKGWELKFTKKHYWSNHLYWLWCRRNSLSTSNLFTPSDYHYQFKRLQFQIKVCFTLTINEAQGQSLKVTGVDLKSNSFSRDGQFYVACSSA